MHIRRSHYMHACIMSYTAHVRYEIYGECSEGRRSQRKTTRFGGLASPPMFDVTKAADPRLGGYVVAANVHETIESSRKWQTPIQIVRQPSSCHAKPICGSRLQSFTTADTSNTYQIVKLVVALKIAHSLHPDRIGSCASGP